MSDGRFNLEAHGHQPGDDSAESRDVDLVLARIPRNEGDLLLSTVEERLWVLEQLKPRARNSFTSVRLRGSLDIAALEAALTEILRRHESLRTNYRIVGGRPRRLIRSPSRFPVRVIDITEVSADELTAEAERITDAESRIAFRLDRDPLIRCALLRLNQEEHLLVLTRHPLVCDGPSVRVFWAELAAFYRAHITQSRDAISDPPIQFADYAVWQRKTAGLPTHRSDLRYWRQQLTEGLARLQLPLSGTSEPKAFRCKRACIELEETVRTALEDFSRQQEERLSTVLLAAFKTLLHRYTGEERIVVGTPLPERERPELNQLIGCFTRQIALCTDLSGNPTFRDLLFREHEVLQQADAHRELPFEVIVKELKPDDYHGLGWPFQALFVHQDGSHHAPNIQGLIADPMDVLETAEAVDLALYSSATARGLTIAFEYDEDKFSDQTISRMLEHVHSLLAGIAANPDECILALPILGQAEQQMLDEWNDTQVDYARDLCLHERFEYQARSAPEKIAITYGSQELTFRKLSELSNQLGHLLQKRGVRVGEVVGLSMKRSEVMAIAILGILKAGCAVLLLDPSLPGERRAFMLKDAAAKLVLTQADLRTGASIGDADVEHIEVNLEAIAGESPGDLGREVTPNDIACIVYTSGSTGVPKGVAMSHRNAISATLPETAVHPLTDVDVFLVTTYSFLMPDIFWPWFAGARAVIASDEGYGDVSYLANLIVDQQVTFACFVPSILQLLLEEDRFTSSTSLKKVVVTGEPLLAELKERFLSRTTADLFNAYGQAEAGSTVGKCELDGTDGYVPVGRPCANVKIYILDSYMQPVPIGVPGEIFIRSENMAMGYLNRPELTAAKFVTDPFSSEPGGHFCRTGDLGRYREDGTIELLGRIDLQVKVRGYRVELGEVEGALSSHPEISRAAVAVRTDSDGSPRLVAYFVPSPGRAPTVTDLRAHLSNLLPKYMVPAAWVMLDHLPLLRNGKVNRNALPDPAPTRPDLDQRLVEPQTATQRTLRDGWIELLEYDHIGIDDDFFELGGNSLLATRSVSQIKDIFDIEFSLQDFFDAPTVAAIAATVDERKVNKPSGILPTMRSVSREGNLPLSVAQERVWALERLIPGTPLFSMPLALRLKGHLSLSALQHALDVVVERHEVLRTTFVVGPEGGVSQCISRAQSLAIVQVDLSNLSRPDLEREVTRLAIKEALRPFDLERGSVCRVTLLRLTEDEHVLLLTLHHIASDLWSMNILARDISAAYRAYLDSRTPSLPDLPVQYADFAAWQRACVEQGAFHAQLSFWKRQLAGRRGPLRLDPSAAPPDVPSFEATREPLIVPSALSADLRDLGRRAACTPFMVILCALKIALCNLTGQKDILVATRAANRSQTACQELVGLFLNALFLRTDLSGDPTMSELLRRVRSTALNAYANQDLPFEVLVPALESEFGYERSDLFQILFVFEDAPMRMPSLPGLTLELHPASKDLPDINQSVTTSDLILHLRDDAAGFTGEMTYRRHFARVAPRISTLLRTAMQEMVSGPD